MILVTLVQNWSLVKSLTQGTGSFKYTARYLWACTTPAPARPELQASSLEVTLQSLFSFKSQNFSPNPSTTRSKHCLEWRSCLPMPCHSSCSMPRSAWGCRRHRQLPSMETEKPLDWGEIRTVSGLTGRVPWLNLEHLVTFSFRPGSAKRPIYLC